MGKFRRRLLKVFFYLCPKLCWRLVGVSFYGPCSTWRAGHLDPSYFIGVALYNVSGDQINEIGGVFQKHLTLHLILDSFKPLLYILCGVVPT